MGDELLWDALEQLLTQDSTLVINETDFLTLGGKSEGVSKRNTVELPDKPRTVRWVYD